MVVVKAAIRTVVEEYPICLYARPYPIVSCKVLSGAWLLSVDFLFNGSCVSSFCHFRDPLSKIFFLIKGQAVNSCEHGLGCLDERTQLLIQCTAKFQDNSWLSQTQKEGGKRQNLRLEQYCENLERLIWRRSELVLCLEFEEKGLFQTLK